MTVFYVDPAYLDVPWVAHVPRKAVLLRMCVPCWEDSCHDCLGRDCLCACETRWTAPRCRNCGYLHGTIGHLKRCEPQWLDARVQALADAIGRAA